MKKRLISLLLVLSMALSMFPVTALAATNPLKTLSAKERTDLLENPFKDVAEEDWCFDAVQYARINGFFNGTTEKSFTPSGTMTRGMFVTVLGRIAGVDPAKYTGEPAFSDVPESKYYAPYVAWASKYGITLGVDEEHFDPNGKINRQQMAAFLVRYFDAFDVNLETDANITTIPADLDTVSDYAKDSVLRLWKTGMLNGDGTNFNPKSSATRAQTATLCMRTDRAVETWYTEPGVPSTRVSIEPKDLEYVQIKPSDRCYVTFYDGTRVIAVKECTVGEPVPEMPTVEQYSKPGAVLVGYYLDREFNTPFYADSPINWHMEVFAKYQELDRQEVLNLTTFTQMDQDPSLSFRIKRVSGTVDASEAAAVVSKDGSDPVAIRVAPASDDCYTVYAPEGFREGCTYELTLADGWVFDGKADTIRTASFSIMMEEVANLRMNKDIKYIQDKPERSYTIAYEINDVPGTKTYSVLESDSLDIAGATPGTVSGSFTYVPAEGEPAVAAGDLLCIYVGLHPNDRIAMSNDDDPTNDKVLFDPAVYVKATAVNGNIVTFTLMSAEDQQKLYEVPDLFPFMVEELPTKGGSMTVDVGTLDLSMYETAMGKIEGTVRKARDKVSVGDYVVFYTRLSALTALSDLSEVAPLQYGLVTGYDKDSGTITYTFCTEEDLMNSMDLYSVVDVQGNDLVSDAQAAALEQSMYEQVSASGFAEEAAYLLSDLVTKTDNFRDDLKIQDMLLTDSEGNVLSDEDIQLMNLGSSFELTDDVKLTVELIKSGKQLHFNEGVQLAIGVDASFEVEAEDGKVAIDLSATFVQEATVKPTVKGELTHTNILGIKFPNGVQVNANVDVKSYTALSFAAEIYTVADQKADTWSELQNMVKEELPSLAGIPAEFAKGMETVGDVIDQINELQNAIDRGTLAVNQVNEYKNDIETLWRVLESNNLASREDWEELGAALGKTSVTSELMDMMNLSAETGLSAEYYDSVEALLQKYNDTVTKETDWITLLEKQIFAVEVCVCGICIGVDANFVVRADMSIAIGSNLEYEVGKRYSFWFKIGLYSPTAGNDTTDLIDEKFAFQFYVMGKLGVKAGVRASLYAGIGSKTVASVGIAAEMGPYIKLWGFFVYEYSKYRPANTQKWTYQERMMGGILMEFGLYFMLSFEAQALGLFEYSHDFLDEEIPLLTAGSERYYYDMAYEPATDEAVFLYDNNSTIEDGITMQLPDSVRSVAYMELRNGRRGSEVMPWSDFKMTLSSPYFSVTPDGKITVHPSDTTRYIECDLTITYLKGKAAFSNYDMTVTVPIVWTNLALSELKEYYTVSVQVGNSSRGFDTIWSDKVLKGQPFTFPTEAEVKAMLDEQGVKYTVDGGYKQGYPGTADVIKDTAVQFYIKYPSYQITVEDIERADGTTYDKTFTAEYGETFDFSELKRSGWAEAGVKYNKFANVTTNATISVKVGEDNAGNAVYETRVIDLTQPITGKTADALSFGNVTATANYIDSSIKAIFTFSGILHDENTAIVTNNEVTEILGQGMVPDLTNVAKAVDEFPGDDGVAYAIASIAPNHTLPIYNTTNYIVTCVNPSGERNLVHFDPQGGLYRTESGNMEPEIAPMNKLVGSLLVNLPVKDEMFLTGYDFDGWFTEIKDESNNYFETKRYGFNNSDNALTQTVPDRLFVEVPVETPEEEGGEQSGEEPGEVETVLQEVPYTVHAQWTPKVYTVTFDLNGGDELHMYNFDGKKVEVDVTGSKWDASIAYSHKFGNYYSYTESAENLHGLSNSTMYVGLPKAYSKETRLDPDGQLNDEKKPMYVGVSFSGWYYDFDGDGDWFEDGEEVTDEMIYNFTKDVTLKARWRTKVAIPHKVFTFKKEPEPVTVTYDTKGHEPVRTYHTHDPIDNHYYYGHYYYLDKDDVLLELPYPAEDDGYVMDYKIRTDLHIHEYVKKGTLPYVAGVYDVRIERPADDDYEKMSWFNPYCEVLIIKKRTDSALSAATVNATVNGAAVFLSYSSLTGAVGDGALEYSIDGGSNWSSTGAFYNLDPGTYYVKVRLGEGMNYLESNSITTSTSFTISEKKTIGYKVEIHTKDNDINSGTGAPVSVTFGGKTSGPFTGDFGEGDKAVRNLTNPDGVIMDGSPKKLTVKLGSGGAMPGWEMSALYLLVCDGDSELKRYGSLGSGAFDEEDSKEFDVSVTGRNVSKDSYGLGATASGDTISINSTISDDYKSSYDPLFYSNAPKFVASFKNPIFNKYLTRTGLYTYSIATDKLDAAMEAYRIDKLTLEYGIEYDSHTGIMGAPDEMTVQIYTHTLEK